MKAISGIYKIQSKCKPERCYIGSAVDISERWRLHLVLLRKNIHHSLKLQNHFNKYGESDLQFSILLGCEKEYLIVNEQYFIDSYKSWFNICPLAHSPLGVKHTCQSKENMRLAHIGKPSGNKGRQFTEEHCRKLSESHIGKASGAKGKYHTEEARQKNRLAHLGKPSWNKGKKLPPQSEETCRKISESHKGKHLSDETRHKKSMSMKAYFAAKKLNEKIA